MCICIWVMCLSNYVLGWSKNEHKLCKFGMVDDGFGVINEENWGRPFERRWLSDQLQLIQWWSWCRLRNDSDLKGNCPSVLDKSHIKNLETRTLKESVYPSTETPISRINCHTKPQTVDYVYDPYQTIVSVFRDGKCSSVNIGGEPRKMLIMTAVHIER